VITAKTMARMTCFEILAPLLLLCSSCAHVPDAQLIANFSKNEPSFVKLKDMAVEDTVYTLISPRMVRSRHTGLTEAGRIPIGMDKTRYRDYINLFKILGLANGVFPGRESVWFNAEAPSLWNGSVTKGYFFCAYEPAGLIVGDLDGYVPAVTADSKRRRFLVLRPIKEHWYIYKLSNG
jgi:hypothetical protein